MFAPVAAPLKPERSSTFSPHSKADRSEPPRTVTEMVRGISGALDSAIAELHSVNSETKILALNARIEAMRAGSHGAAFGVVAAEMQNLSERTSQIANAMASRTRDKTTDLIELIESSIRGTRLSDLALVNVDLIDRNLYERTCDVRWWATDGSLVDALTYPTSESRAFASKRLGVILDAYTVYYDLVLCDASGRIVANGRPNLYQTAGLDQANTEWYHKAMQSASGNDYGFQTAHPSPLVNNQNVLVYSCGVRTGGNADGELLGALGIFFNWSGLANPILNEIPVDPSEKNQTEAYIVDGRGQVLACNAGSRSGAVVELPELQRVFESPKGFYLTKRAGRPICVGHARAPGFETYSTGWYSIVVQPVEL